ncbi:hypothetical protein POM88_041429 [Heracleum sosnowskyi]|uniref:Uncharacterized protein n=1 Tax=Heracleum sosnowskyi TaxID=360622 RepID=A0AAD8MBC7_9APIA|nr:hypothetical protein POM88_041429 [Heracleum sosnowskyi]
MYDKGGRKLLQVEEEKMVVARRMKADNIKDYDPVEANPKHDPDLNPHVDPPSQPDPPRQAAPPDHETDPPRDIGPPDDRSGIYHHVHHQPHPGSTPFNNIPAPAPFTTTTNDGV